MRSLSVETPYALPPAFGVVVAGAGSSAVQCGQRVAPSFTSSRQKGHFGASCSSICLPRRVSMRARLRAFTMRNTTSAMMRNWMTALMKLP